MGREDLLRDSRFASTSKRAENQVALRDILERIFANDDAAAWLDRFRAASVPCAAINTYSQVLADPQVQHMGWVQALALPNGHGTQTFGPPVQFSGKGVAITRPPPALGEHNDEVFGKLGTEPVR